jgi:copper(I)-binding protein
VSPLVASVFALSVAAAQGVPAVSARNGWIREAPPGATALAGYVSLANAGATPVHCASVSGPDFGAAELHRTVVEDGVSHMLADQAVEVPAGGVAELAPGGLHVMLFRPSRALHAGDTTTLTFHCGNTAVDATFVIRRTE